MRTIKFRGKDIGTGEWVYGDLLHVGGGCIITTNSELREPLPDGETALSYSKDEIAVVKRETVGLFTGLLDKNGEEIYEGDILMFREEENCNDTLVVMWDKGSFVDEYPNRGEGACIRSNYFAAFPEMFRVVGNIHDNPELLKGGAE